ncbi:18709_t:CDS:2 [Entrophospora sp. SA101]|nr:18709_t:CDS:2 [Entrophospora sp. SA101]
MSLNPIQAESPHSTPTINSLSTSSSNSSTSSFPRQVPISTSINGEGETSPVFQQVQSPLTLPYSPFRGGNSLSNRNVNVINSSSSSATTTSTTLSHTSFSMLPVMERSNSTSTMGTNNISSTIYTPSIAPAFHKTFIYDAPATTKEFEKMELINPNDSWNILVIKVLPLFNGEGLKLAIEDLNELVRRCINDRSPQQLFEDINELLDSGMFTLNGKLKGVPDEKLVSRLVELWSFYFGTVIPYFEGVFLPLQMQVGSHKISIRRLVLMSFRDHVILPIRDRVEDAFNKLFHDFDSGIPVTDTAARMLQMTYILSSIFSDDDKQKDIDRILSKLKNNWNLFMRRRDRRGFVGVSPSHSINVVATDDDYISSEISNNDTSNATTPTKPSSNPLISISATTSPSQY